MKTEKMRKAAKNWDNIVKMIGRIFSVLVWVAVIVGVLVLAFGERIMDMGTPSLELGVLTLYLTEGVEVDLQLIKYSLALSLLISGVVFLLVSRIAKLLRGILDPMKEGRPFDADTPARLRRIAVLVLIGGFLRHISVFVIRGVMIRAFPMEQILTSPLIARAEYTFTLDFGFVWLACAVLLLSYVFEYGQKLQTESDETL